jgi:uncharacterized protein (TIGR02246 family)
MRKSVVTSALILLVTLGGFAARSTAAQKDASDAVGLVSGFVNAWNNHDVKAFGRLFADDADWVMAAGVRMRGRAAIEAALEREHTTWARTTIIAASEPLVRRWSADSAVVLFNWEIREAAVDHTEAPPSRGNTMIVARKDSDEWRIVSGQVARSPAAAQPR